MLILIWALFLHQVHTGENENTIGDVGQGESIFLRVVTGKTILIDVGGKADLYYNFEKWRKYDDQQCPANTLIPYQKS